MINDIIWRAIKRAKIPTHKESTELIMQKGKRPDGATLIPWSRGKALAWDVTIPDTYAASHLQSTTLEAGWAAIHAAEKKCTKYRELDATHIFVPIAIETAGTSNGIDRRNWPTVYIEDRGYKRDNLLVSTHCHCNPERKCTVIHTHVWHRRRHKHVAPPQSLQFSPYFTIS